MAKNEGGEAVSCADLRVVQPLPDIGLNSLPTYAPNDNTDKVNVVSNYSIINMITYMIILYDYIKDI